MSSVLSTPISVFTAFVFYLSIVLLLKTDSCEGQSAVIGPLQPIVASVGDDITLPCHLEPAVDAAAITFEWTRPDLNPRFVHVWRSGENLMDLQNPSYKGRTSISEEKLKSGDISLKLSTVKPSDEGKYRCFLPLLEKDSFVELIVGAVSTSSTVGIERVGHRAVLQCNSTGWHPEPEVFWLDGEGNLLSAGPTETVRGPDDLYTVSSRLTVEKRHSNSFTRRVQQNSTNQIREAHIHVPDDFFAARSSSVPIITGLAVCIMFISAAVFVVWKWRQKKNKTKADPEDNNQEEEKKKKESSDEPEHQHLMGGGRNVKENATIHQDKGGENKTLTAVKNSEEIPLEDLQKRENGQKYSEETETTHKGNQRETSVQEKGSEKQEDNELPSERVQRIEQRMNPPQDTKPKSHSWELIKDTEMFNDKKIVSANREKFSGQSGEGEKNPQAESQRAQGTKQRDTSVLTVAHGHFIRS